jgi:tRNA-Thr(GGU) m(6)t(6)A37 methyltransferase TsaA
MTTFTVEPVAYVRAARATPEDDNWGGTHSTIELCEGADAEALAGLDAFSHAEILFLFDRVGPDQIVRGARHPRGETRWPKVGIFAQRAKNRPNRLGSTIVPIVKVTPTTVVVAELDAIDGTPVLDIKPVIREFLPRTAVKQPSWATELMAAYWNE